MERSIPDNLQYVKFNIIKNEHLSRFEIFVEGELGGFAEYRVNGKVMALPHTFVEPKFGGKGVGGALVAYALEEARSNGLTVAPYCSFVAKVISKENERYGELVSPEFFHLLPSK